MNMKTGFGLAALATLVMTHSASAAVIVGNNDGANCYPFSCFASESGIEYQEVYSASAFPGVTSIGSVTFFNSINGLMDGASYAISFYLTSVSLGGMSTNLANNLGTLLSTFGTFNVSGTMPAELTFDGADFIYDPSQGNLLMDVTVQSLTDPHIYESFFQADYTGTDIVRAFTYSNLSTFANGTGALVTRFNAPDAVPEPGTFALATVGLFALAYVGLRRRAHGVL